MALFEDPNARCLSRLEQAVHDIDICPRGDVDREDRALLVRTPKTLERRPVLLEARRRPALRTKLQPVGRVSTADRDTRKVNLSTYIQAKNDIFIADGEGEEWGVT